jgi:hypothetical protein
VYVTVTETINAKTAIKQITIAGLGIFIVVVPSDGVSNHSESMAFHCMPITKAMSQAYALPLELPKNRRVQLSLHQTSARWRPKRWAA